MAAAQEVEFEALAPALRKKNGAPRAAADDDADETTDSDDALDIPVAPGLYAVVVDVPLVWSSGGG